MDDKYNSWYEEARKQTIDTLPDFMNKVLEQACDYDSIVEAIAACAVGAAWAGEHHPHGGITGFQGSCVMWRFIQHWLRLQNSCGLRLVNYDDMLYPQYKDSFTKTSINFETWLALQKKAHQLLSEDRGVPHVRQHWQSIVDGTYHSVTQSRINYR